MKRLLLGGLALGASLGLMGTANANPMTGTYTIAIYEGSNPNPGNSGDASQQGSNSNSMLAGTPTATITYTGALDFTLNGSSGNTVGAFLASAGGTVPAFTGSSTVISTSGYATQTLFVITGTSYAGESGTVYHDDGASLYQNGSAMFSDAEPNTMVGDNYTLAAGTFELYYVEANGLPAVLNVAVPEPASLALLGTGLLGIGMLRRRQQG